MCCLPHETGPAFGTEMQDTDVWRNNNESQINNETHIQFDNVWRNK